MTSRPSRFLAVLSATVAVALSLFTPALLIAQPTVDRITTPVRLAPSAPPAIVLPAVPAVADSLPPMTLTVSTRWEQAGHEPRVTRQTVLRTVDRVLVAIEGTDSEWLFERNPVDHRRVSGYLIDHKTSRILIHQESDLRNTQQIRGWLDVLTLRFDVDALKELRATGETDTTNGVTFTRHAAPQQTARGIVDVWWSDAELLPRKVTTREGGTTTTSLVESFSSGVDGTRLTPPAMRFPSYRVLDVTDAREPF